MKLTIVGHGYVGLVSSAVFADLGNTVWVIGRNREKINALKKGEIPIYEPGLAEAVKRNVRADRLRFTFDYAAAIAESSIAFICVSTPSAANGEVDLSGVFKVAERIGDHINRHIVIACKSTVPVGTNRKIKELLINKLKVDASYFDVASCPEFLKEGTALADTLHPDRIVIGYENDKARDLLLELHKPIDGTRILTTIETAEMIKYASNALLATKISFANMFAALCEKVGADVEKVLDGVGADKRLGRHFLYPGVGYGGSCLPKDVKAIIKTGEQYGESMRLLKDVQEINDQAATNFFNKAIAYFNHDLDRKTIGILGLAFKPDTDDIREAPSLKLIANLQAASKKVNIQVYDYAAMDNAKTITTNVLYCQSPYEAARNADLLIAVTEWNEFRQLDLGKIKSLMKKPAILDGRNIYDPDKIRKLGFFYQGVGRPACAGRN